MLKGLGTKINDILIFCFSLYLCGYWCETPHLTSRIRMRHKLLSWAPGTTTTGVTTTSHHNSTTELTIVS